MRTGIACRVDYIVNFKNCNVCIFINREFLSSEAGAALKREIPMGRFGEQGDLDGALLLLASDAGSYMAGTTIVADGGQIVTLRG